MNSIAELVQQVKRLDTKDGQLAVTWFLDDVFKLIKNINETSIDESDRFKRIIELEEKYGIPKTHLI